MKISQNDLKRSKEIALLLDRYGRSGLISQMKLDGVEEPSEFETSREGQATPDHSQLK